MTSEIAADYIVVGAGSAGCVLANRLSADPANKVLLLEAGGDDRPLHNLKQFWSNLLIHTPIGFGKTLNDPKVNWIYETEPDPGTGGRPHKWPKGKVLGGSSSINAMLYIRGQAADYDGWAQMGCRGWSYDDVLPYFRRSQNQERGECESHGVGGPLNTCDYSERNEVSQALLDACVEAGIPYSPDINAREQEGVTWFQLTEKAASAARPRSPSSIRCRAVGICASRPRRRPPVSCSRASARSASNMSRAARRRSRAPMPR
jgi:choline dehydrogenase